MGEDYKGYTIEVTLEEYVDEFFDPRRDGDNLGTMVCFHNRYSLPNETDLSSDDYTSWQEVEEAIGRKYDVVALLPIFAYEHSGFWVSTKVEPYWWHYAWDGGRIGVIFATKQDTRKWFGYKHITRDIVVQTIERLRHEVDEYCSYASGELYATAVLDADGEEVDTCTGFTSLDDALQAGKEFIDDLLTED